MAKSLGKTPAELVGSNLLSHFPKEIGELRMKYFESVINGKRTIQVVDYREGRYFSNVAFPILDDAGNVAYGVAFSRDITNEKRLEDQNLLNQEFLYISLIENSMDLTVIISNEGRVIYSSPSMERLLGYNAKNSVSSMVFEFIHPDDLQKTKEIFNEILSTPDYFGKGIYRIRHKDGSYRSFEAFFKNRLYDPQINGIIINSRDITEQEDYRLELLQQKNYLELLVNSISKIIFTINVNNKVNIWNKTTEATTGIKQNEIRGKDFTTKGIFENISEIQSYIDDVSTGKIGFLKNIVLRLPHNDKRIWEVSASSLKQNNEIAEIIFICSDITFKEQSQGEFVPGLSYIILDTKIEKIQDIFKSLLNQNWTGYYISRTNEDIALVFQGNIPKFSSISMDKDKPITISTLDELYNNIATFAKTTDRAVILLDRIDFLITQFSFHEVVKTLYNINDVIKKHKCLFFIRINKRYITEEQYALLQEEFNKLPSRELARIQLNDDEYNMLYHIIQQNEKNNLVTQTYICKEIKISKVTAQKRIMDLSSQGLILSRKQGRIKCLYITEKGKELLKSRNVK